MIMLVMSFLVMCGTSHNSSQLESYGHEKLENPYVAVWLGNLSLIVE
jgi:hypothetical protein